jgi:hypothetical protein
MFLFGGIPLRREIPKYKTISNFPNPNDTNKSFGNWNIGKFGFVSTHSASLRVVLSERNDSKDDFRISKFGFN